MSLTSLQTASAANEGRAMPVLHPTDRVPLLNDKKVPVTITVRGRDSDAFIKAENEARNRAVERTSKAVKFSAAASDLEACQTLARCTTGWQGVPAGWLDGSDNEAPAEFSYDNAVALYTNPGVSWIREQVDQFVAARVNFLKSAPTS